MKKKRTVTPATIERYIREGRGEGTFQDFSEWIKIRRSELQSKGYSTRHNQNGRISHELSKVETNARLFASMNPKAVDLRAQFPLRLEAGVHEINAYTNEYGEFYPGTLEIAKNLGIRHIRMMYQSDPLRFTTDLLITLKTDKGLKLIAVSCKKNLPKDKRTLDKLRIEKTYWDVRGVEWILFTPELYARSFVDTLKAFSFQALQDSPVDIDLKKSIAIDVHEQLPSYAELFKNYISRGYEAAEIQHAFWNAFWFGLIPMKIGRVFEPLRKIQLLSPDEFMQINPIYNGRSSWI